jgi:hypothetical protein
MGEVREPIYEFTDVDHRVWDDLIEEIMDTLITFVPIFKNEKGEYTIDIDFPDEW